MSYDSEDCPACGKKINRMAERTDWLSDTEIDCPHCEVTIHVTAEAVPVYTLTVKQPVKGEPPR